MKVSVPLEFDMDERFGIALSRTGELRLATREECREWVNAWIAGPKADLRGTVADIKKQFERPEKASPDKE